MATEEEEESKIWHSGGCHCGAVRFRVRAKRTLKCIICNCSVCKKKQNIHFIAPQDDFELIKGHESITTYTFNTHAAKHMFCKICGVQSFYRPRSNPDGYGVMPHCIDDEGTIESISYEAFEGSTWEDTMLERGEELKQRSAASKT